MEIKDQSGNVLEDLSQAGILVISLARFAISPVAENLLNYSSVPINGVLPTPTEVESRSREEILYGYLTDNLNDLESLGALLTQIALDPSGDMNSLPSEYDELKSMRLIAIGHLARAVQKGGKNEIDTDKLTEIKNKIKKDNSEDLWRVFGFPYETQEEFESQSPGDRLIDKLVSVLRSQNATIRHTPGM